MFAEARLAEEILREKNEIDARTAELRGVAEEYTTRQRALDAEYVGISQEVEGIEARMAEAQRLLRELESNLGPARQRLTELERERQEGGWAATAAAAVVVVVVMVLVLSCSNWIIKPPTLRKPGFVATMVHVFPDGT